LEAGEGGLSCDLLGIIAESPSRLKRVLTLEGCLEKITGALKLDGVSGEEYSKK
jgi:hypothetical protein